MNLRPQRNFSIVRQIADHTDLTTYYVRAVIRDSYTDTILDTLNLTARGSQRFSKNWQVPADPSGQGRDISIVTSVYTDSGYTTKSSTYGDEENSYLIEDLPLRSGGTDIDAYTVRRIFKEELQTMIDAEAKIKASEIKPEDIEEPMRWDELLHAITELKTALKPEAPEKLDISPILSAIDAAMKAIQAKEVTEPTDLSPVHNKLDAAEKEHDLTMQELKALLTDMSKKLEQAVATEVKKAIGETKFISQFSTTAMPHEAPKQPKDQPAVDINQLFQ